ncbi:YtxH domain-containing protein [Flavobacterium sp. WC2421]|jgi:gas vesicle protein|uniref:YtxH domain-containing protein n=3 Tax=unclassified Flavobacterium TaxID=196869 RepID=A0AB39W5X1_9FLAO
MKTDKVILGVLGGLAAGAIMGILFAPDKGEKTRKKIKRKSNDYADDLKDKYETALDTISKKYETLKQEGQDLYIEGKSKFDKTKKELENLDIKNLNN